MARAGVLHACQAVYDAEERVRKDADKSAVLVRSDAIEAVGGDCPGKTELHPDILRRPDVRVVVEFEPQSRIEGEIQQMESDFVVAELTDVLAGRRPGRVGEREVTIFDSVGFALEDFAALRYLRRVHQELRGSQQQIDLVPDLDNPKNLFGLLARTAVTVSRPVAVLA
jgi:ornithine cyclodeaminase